MDILSRTAEAYRDWVAGLDYVVQMFLLRWAWILVSLLACGSVVKQLYPRFVTDTRSLQVLAVVGGLVLGFGVDIEEAFGGRHWDTFVSIAMVTAIVLPYFLPHVLARRRGIQDITRIVIYAAGLLLLIIQLLTLTWK